MQRRKFGFILSSFLVLALALSFGIVGGVQQAKATARGWSVVSSPNVGTGFNTLNGVYEIGISNIWAVGYYNDGSINHSVLYEWNTTTKNWDNHSVDLPIPPGSDPTKLVGVSMLSGTDVWMVGTDYGSFTVPWTAYRNSTGWHQHSFTPYDGTMYTVDTLAASSVWVGGIGPHGCCTNQHSLYWDGNSWTVQNGADGDGFTSISGLSVSESWGVGDDGSHTLIERFIYY